MSPVAWGGRPGARAALVATVIVATVGAGVGVKVIGPSTPTAGTANLWVDTNGGTCTRQSTAGAYVDAQACSSLNAAYSAASCGDAVIIKGGTYSGQTVSYRSALASCGSRVAYTVAEGETVNVSGDINLDGARHLSLVSPSVTNFVVTGALAISPNGSSQIPADLVVSYIDFGSGGGSGDYYIDALQGGTISHNDFGPTLTTPSSEHESKFWYNTSGSPNTTGVTFEYNIVHDATSSGGAHTSCGLISYATNSTFRGNTFVRCDNEGLLVKAGGSGGGSPGNPLLANLTFESNFFSAACGSCGVGADAGLSFHGITGNGDSGSPYSGFVIRGNSFHDPPGFNVADTVFTASYFTGNILPRTNASTTGSTCAPGLTSAYNVFVGGPQCGTNPISAGSYPYVSATDVLATIDYHLSGSDGSTVADDAVPTGVAGGCASYDIDGVARPVDAACDAGGDER